MTKRDFDAPENVTNFSNIGVLGVAKKYPLKIGTPQKGVKINTFQLLPKMGFTDFDCNS